MTLRTTIPCACCEIELHPSEQYDTRFGPVCSICYEECALPHDRLQ